MRGAKAGCQKDSRGHVPCVCSSDTKERLLGKEASTWAGGDYGRWRSGQKREQDMPGTKQLGRQMLRGVQGYQARRGHSWETHVAGTPPAMTKQSLYPTHTSAGARST